MILIFCRLACEQARKMFLIFALVTNEDMDEHVQICSLSKFLLFINIKYCCR